MWTSIDPANSAGARLLRARCGRSLLVIASLVQVRRTSPRIGNQVLVHQSPIRASGDDPFSDKRVGFREMQLALMQEVAKESQWTEAAIADRQATLARLAVRTWKIGVLGSHLA